MVVDWLSWLIDPSRRVLRSTNGGRSQEEDIQDEDPQPSCERLEAERPGAQQLPALRLSEVASRGLSQLWLVQGPRRDRRQLIQIVR
jgi:hypothetical protein